MKRFLLFLLLGALSACSCNKGSGKGGSIRIGIDPAWYPIDFGSQTSYVNGYVEDLLIEMARYSGAEFEKIHVSWDFLTEGMKQKKYDAILTSMPPYNFNLAQYEFSDNILELGPVLIVPVGSRHTELASMAHELVGVVIGDPATLILQRYPDLISRSFPSIPDLLNALATGEIEGAVLNRIPAINYVSDLYANKLKVVGKSLNTEGLHLAVLKGASSTPISLFNKSLDSLKKKQKLSALQKKWQLDSF
jgi:ABC-type amino acid transport substrate-binding protein